MTGRRDARRQDESAVYEHCKSTIASVFTVFLALFRIRNPTLYPAELRGLVSWYGLFRLKKLIYRHLKPQMTPSIFMSGGSSVVRRLQNRIIAAFGRADNVPVYPYPEFSLYDESLSSGL